MGIDTVWKAQSGSQTLFLSCPVFECLYEGTRGPGKTDALLMSFAKFVGRGFGPAWKGVLFRREYKELQDVVSKSKRWFTQAFPKARFLESLSDYKWRFETGEELLFRTAKTPNDYWSYHGHEYPWIGWEELTNWPDSRLYEDMMSVCRCSVPGLPRMYRATANPYGAGHSWVKSRFIDPAPRGSVVKDDRGRQRVAIHGSLFENKILLKNDPEYLKNLESITDPNKRKAWLLGDWDIVAGGALDDVWDRNRHVIQPFEIPKTWRIDRSFDWGSSRPFSVGWWAEADGSTIEDRAGSQKTYPKGTLFRIAEYYGWNGRPNEGCRMLAVNVAREILKIEKQIFPGRIVKAGPADPAIYAAENGVSIADDMARVGVSWILADNRPGSRATGLEAMRKRLAAGIENQMEEPGLFVFEGCQHFIRTVPVLPRDSKKMDDVDTNAEDHVYDESRYRCLQVVKKSTSLSISMR